MVDDGQKNVVYMKKHDKWIKFGIFQLWTTIFSASSAVFFWVGFVVYAFMEVSIIVSATSVSNLRLLLRSCFRFDFTVLL